MFFTELLHFIRLGQLFKVLDRFSWVVCEKLAFQTPPRPSLVFDGTQNLLSTPNPSSIMKEYFPWKLL